MKIKKHSENRVSNINHNLIQNTLKFGSLFTPSAFKDISLFFRNETKYNNFLLGKPQRRILVKQSYMFLIWIRYLTTKPTNALQVDKSTNNVVTRYPSFFVYPFRNYKTTITKAPMAHKTYSQEQFMVRFYKFSVSFYTETQDLNKRGNLLETPSSFLNDVNKGIFFAHYLKTCKPYIGTNMLFLHKYTIIFYSNDGNYFTFKTLTR